MAAVEIPEEADASLVDDYVQLGIHLFHSQRRRIIIHQLHDAAIEAGDEPATIDQFELAAEVAAVEDSAHPDDVDRTSEKSVKTGLRRNHLPLLEENGIVNWNYSERTIETTPRTAVLGELLLEIEAAIRDSGLASVCVPDPDDAEGR
jgi:hypothetical protein